MARDGLQWNAQWRWADSVCLSCRQLLDILKQRIKQRRQIQPHIACFDKLQIHILLHFTNPKLVLQCQNRQGGTAPLPPPAWLRAWSEEYISHMWISLFLETLSHWSCNVLARNSTDQHYIVFAFAFVKCILNAQILLLYILIQNTLFNPLKYKTHVVYK